MRGMGSTFHQLGVRYNGSLTPTAPKLYGYGEPLPLAFKGMAKIAF